MSEIDGTVKMPADSIACPLRKADGTPCAWTYAYDAIEVRAGRLIEVFAPGAIAPSSKGYASWYESVEKMISLHLVNAHPLEDWARTLTTMRTEHHGALEQLHADYSERINDLSERLRRAEDGRNERTRQLNEAGAKIAQLEGERDERLTLPESSTLARMVDNLREDAKESEALQSRLERLLTETANALKGEPAPLTLHDWSDLPAVAAALKARVLQLEEMTVLQLEIGHPVTGEPAPGPDMREMVEAAWVLIANAGVPTGDWDSQGAEWVKAAVAWRERYHAWLDVRGVPVGEGLSVERQPESTHSAA